MRRKEGDGTDIGSDLSTTGYVARWPASVTDATVTEGYALAQALRDSSKQPVALARPPLQRHAGNKPDLTALPSDQAVLLQGRQQAVDPRTAASQHNGEPLL